MNLKNSKEAILNHAVTIFGRLGFHKTTMSDIAAASKRGRRTIYTYFRTKEEVYEAVIEREITKIIQNIQDGQCQQDNVVERMESYLNQRLLSIIELTNQYDAVKMAYFKNYNWIEKIRRELDARDRTILEQIIKTGVERNQFTLNATTDDTITNILMMIKGFEFVLIIDNKPEQTATQLNFFTQTLLNGLLTR